MAKPELGTKRTCVNDGIRFYDLNKVPAVCPKCGTEQPIEQPRLKRTGGNVVEEKRPIKKVPAPGLEDADTDVEVADDEEAEDVLEDTSDLEDDADAIGTDIEAEPDTDEKEMNPQPWSPPPRRGERVGDGLPPKPPRKKMPQI